MRKYEGDSHSLVGQSHDGMRILFTNQDVYSLIMNQMREWWYKATVRVGNKPDRTKREFFLGHILHSIQDSFAPGHTVRTFAPVTFRNKWHHITSVPKFWVKELDPKLEEPTELGGWPEDVAEDSPSARSDFCGPIALYQGYDMQGKVHDWTDHDPFKQQEVSETESNGFDTVRRKQLWTCAVDYSAELLQKWTRCMEDKNDCNFDAWFFHEIFFPVRDRALTWAGGVPFKYSKFMKGDAYKKGFPASMKGEHNPKFPECPFTLWQDEGEKAFYQIQPMSFPYKGDAAAEATDCDSIEAGRCIMHTIFPAVSIQLQDMNYVEMMYPPEMRRMYGRNTGVMKPPADLREARRLFEQYGYTGHYGVSSIRFLPRPTLNHLTKWGKYELPTSTAAVSLHGYLWFMDALTSDGFIFDNLPGTQRDMFYAWTLVHVRGQRPGERARRVLEKEITIDNICSLFQPIGTRAELFWMDKVTGAGKAIKDTTIRHVSSLFDKVLNIFTPN